MIVKVHEHTIEIVKTPVNELEVNVTRMQFVFDETIPTNYVKKAFFTNGDVSKVIELVNDECNIPVEVLHKKGQVRVGVIAYEVQDETLIERFNPRPAYFTIWEGSLIEADNTEPITPTDKEQIEQMLSNINIDGSKTGKITTITITYKDGTTKELQLEDGKSIEYNWQGTQLGIRQEGQSEYVYVDLKGEKGDAGSIKFIIVETLPSENIDESAIYLTPSENPDLKNYYDEWIWVVDRFEPLGETQIEVDLTDYVQFTDYASSSKGGVIKVGSAYNAYSLTSEGYLQANIRTYEQYQQDGNKTFMGKGTLELVITGQGLITNQVNDLANYYTKTEIDNTIGDIGTILDSINNEVL